MLTKKYFFMTVGILFIGMSVARADSTPSAVRSLSHSKGPGHTVHVSLKIEPALINKAYAVEEKYPKTCRSSKVDNNGTADQPTRTIKWGVFFDAQTRTLTYDLVCSGDTTSLAPFKGLASFDGQSIDVGGDQKIKPVSKRH